MLIPQLTFPGIDLVRGWSFTLSPGIFPSVALVEVAPQFGMPADVGTLTISTADVSISFAGCALDSAQVRRDGAGMVVSLAILDRRWAWRFGQISGRYNVRDESGTLDPATVQTPQQLATLLLTAMGESSADVSQLPNDARPFVDWVYENPAAELAKLAESLGCRVVLGLGGTVALALAGTGAALPVTGTERTRNFGIDPPSRPDSLLVVCGASRFETMFRLEAVGLEPTGEIRRIADLSYAPAGGWANESWLGFGNIADPNSRAKARQSVYRWYRIKCTAPLNTAEQFTITGYSGTVSNLWQLLPVEPNRVAVFADVDGIERPKPPEVAGIYWDRTLDGANLPAQRKYRGSFTLDLHRGIVHFAEPVFQMAAGGTSGFSEAELYLTVAHPVRDAASRQPVRQTATQSLPGPAVGTGPAVIRRDDLVFASQTTYDGSNNPTGATDNSSALDTETAAQLTASLARFETLQTDYVEYAGLVPVSPDGAITQVQWIANAAGVITRASRNSSFSWA